VVAPPEVRTAEAPADAPPPDHTHVQWTLAALGRSLGCQVWVAANDRARAWAGEPLGALSVDRLPPLGLDPASERLVRLIDVVWLRGAHQVVAAFEVERTTSVHSGLLRMADLAALAPNLSFPLYVVVPRARLGKVRRELARPTFQALDLHRRCAFFSAEALLDAAPEITRWASGPGVIEKLAERVRVEL
jgi:type II restriction enzyme